MNHLVTGNRSLIFPNLFRTSSAQKESRIQELLSRAIFRILHNTNVLHRNPQSQELSTHDFFAKLRLEVEKLDANAKLYVSGGAMRSLFAKIYDDLLKGHQIHAGNQEKITEEILERIIEEDRRYALWDVLGIGSDLDLLVDGLPKGAAVACLSPFTIPSDNERLSTLHYDINEYNPQMQRALKQGGSTLDFLSFSLCPNEGFRTPDSLPIIPNFLKGRVAILPMDGAESISITTARIIRTFLEAPFLEPQPEHLPLTEKAIQKLAQDLPHLDQDTRFKVQEQFKKAVRNTRFFQACNRLAWPTPGNTALEIAWRQMPGKPFPEFLDHQSIQARSETFDPGDLRAKGLLTSMESFVAEFTDKGLLYHGTPDRSNLLCMIRTGFYVSSDHQGGAQHGRGFYTTKDPETARKYCGRQEGAICLLSLNRSPHMRILQIDRCPPEIVEEAKEKQQDLHKYLAEVYGIDIIIKCYPLVQNMDALVRPKDVSEWIQTVQKPIMDRISRLSPRETPNDLDDFVTDWKASGEITDNISWMLYQTRPLRQQLLKTIIPYFKRGEIDWVLRFLEKLELLNTWQCRDEFRDEIQTVILHGSQQEVENMLHISSSHLRSDHFKMDPDSRRLIMSWLPHMTEVNILLIGHMIVSLNADSDTQLLEDITTYCIPLLQGKYSIQFNIARQLVSYLSRRCSTFPTIRLIPIFCERAKSLFASEDVKTISKVLDHQPDPEYRFISWVPQQEYIALLKNAFKTFVNCSDNGAQRLCVNILKRLIFIQTRFDTDDEIRRSISLNQQAKERITPPILQNLIQLLKQTPDVVTTPDMQAICKNCFFNASSQNDFGSILLPIFMDPASSPEIKEGARICLSGIADSKEGFPVSQKLAIRLAKASDTLYLHPNSFKK